MNLRKDAAMQIPPMQISLIAAMDEERLIGASYALPWRLPADMQWFRKQTMGKPVVMGRNTYTSIGKPLPGRLNIVLSRNRKLKLEGCCVIHDLDQLQSATENASEVMVIGGSEIYELTLPLESRMYLTGIAASFEGDAWFPDFNAAEWAEVYREDHAADELNKWPYCFRILERITKTGNKHR